MVARLLPLLLVTLFGLAGAREAILDFRAELELLPGGHLAVTEDLTVRIEHDRIRRGIYRDLLKRPVAAWGAASATAVRYTIEGARLDGAPIPWRVQTSAQGLRVYLGSPDALAPLGVHRYTLRYRAKHAAVARAGRGALEWNVTGNEWSFPIERTGVRLVLPPGLDPYAVEARAFYGPLGSRASSPLRPEAEALVFRLDAPLPPGSGLTLYAAWPLAALPVDEAPLDPLVAGLGLVLAALVLFEVWAWRRVGRDPGGAPVIPRFRPPEGVSAALAAYLQDRSLTPRAFAAAVAELAARGFLEVSGGSEPRLVRTAKPTDERLPRELRALLEALVPARRPQLALDRAHAETLQEARSGLGRNLARRAAPYLRPNHAAALAGAGAVTLVLAALAGHLAGEFGVAVFAGAAVLFYLLFAAAALHAAALAWERYRLVPGVSPLAELLRAGGSLLFVFGVPLLGGLFLGLFAGMAAGLLAAGLVLVGAFGLYLMPALTPEGAAVWRQLLGLARYLGTTDAAELRRIEAPEDTPETLRALYPYAVALGVESAFARRLERYLSVHPEAAPRTLLWSPSEDGAPRAGFAGFSTGVSRALQTAYARVGSASGSGSGSFSGGFSGGGGGGGGGGGW
ncbi:Protein of unknown function DUF2207, membrane [Oceanithermus profundus DSM 14977]|uniref:DUF2207 domain-containing protein n=1 Tax=Oceanithermus profundus (strain DSM 14977 / NBRC 100410 / VKM B-2274 / 506) TaxID=670487 RepID=E4U630_OCEP5|nr:DUF2207 domain-containing protein [Oceanithermus profundus]ADR35851.1 Protein of unknown function DUF2207, membrane [Oceanithermus profundus DSM 14977]